MKTIKKAFLLFVLAGMATACQKNISKENPESAAKLVAGKTTLKNS